MSVLKGSNEIAVSGKQKDGAQWKTLAVSVTMRISVEK